LRLLDAYDLRARVAVTYLVFSPVTVFVVAFALGSREWWARIGGVAVACGGPLIAAQWGRSAGRRKEQRLWDSWGGSPTLALLRYASGGPRETVERRHVSVSRATGIDLPNYEAETANPDGADVTYTDAVSALRELTRSKTEFDLVFEELANYGLRRNLWGRKPFGVATAATTAICSAVLLAGDLSSRTWGSTVAAIISLSFALSALLIWLLMVTPGWVKESADAYALRLLESSVRLPTYASPR
jgi:hypothetical protein